MSANLVVDIGGACQLGLTLGFGGAGSGNIYAASGGVIGQSINLGQANTYCNIIAQGVPLFASGQLRLQVQCSDSDTSGNFTDPTSGLPSTAYPTSFSSGGLLWLNSGAVGSGLLTGGTSGQSLLSGFAVAAAFQRPTTFARVNVVSGDFYAGLLSVAFISQLRTTGSGGGFSYSPSSGVVNV